LNKSATGNETQILQLQPGRYTPSAWEMYGGNVLWIPVFVLTGFGILFVYSASSLYALQTYKDEFYFVKKQILFLIPSLLGAYAAAKVPFETWFKIIKYLFFVTLFLTFATHIPHVGRRISGAPRWLNLGPMSVQPAEFLKVVSLLFCVYFVTKNHVRHHWFYLAALLLAPIAILSQKDLGTTLVVVAGYLAILFMNGLPKRYLFGTFGFLTCGFITAVVVEPYRIVRVMTFLNPFQDPLGAGFQVIQSFVAIANGGVYGRGIGESQQKLFFLPEAHTDFILAVITEEMGFIGVLAIAILYSVLFYAILRLVLYGKFYQDRLLASGCFTMLGLTTIINMGVVAGALPTKGLPLPFISNGGSTLIADYIIIGLMSQISSRIYK